MVRQGESVAQAMALSPVLYNITVVGKADVKWVLGCFPPKSVLGNISYRRNCPIFASRSPGVPFAKFLVYCIVYERNWSVSHLKVFIDLI